MRERLGIARRRADGDRRGRIPAFLRKWPVHRRLHGCAETAIDGILDDADDLVHGIVPARPEVQLGDLRAHRLDPWQEPLREGAVDHDHGRRALLVAGVEVPTAGQTQPHGVEPARADEIHP